MISICIPVRNAGAEFRDHLRRWKRQDIQEEFEVVVLDSESNDETVHIALSEGARVHGIPGDAFNHGDARNRLAELARGDVLVFTVQDAYPASPHTLRELVQPLWQAPDIVGVTGKQIPRPDANLMARWETEYHARLYDKGARKKLFPPPTHFARLDLTDKVEVISFDNVCSAMRRSVWERFRFPSVDFGEDLHWSYQVMRAGHAIFHNPAAQVHHSHNRPAWVRLKRFFITRYSLHRLFQISPEEFPWSEQQTFAALSTFRRLVGGLRRQLYLSPNDIRRLRLLRSTGYLIVRALEKWGPGFLNPAARRLHSYFPWVELTRHFNFVCRQILTYYGSLSANECAGIVDLAEAQAIGDFLGRCYYRGECLNSLSQEFAALGEILHKYS